MKKQVTQKSTDSPAYGSVGRPRSLDEAVSINLVIESQMNETLRQKAFHERTTKSEIIRTAVRRYLNEQA